MRKALLGLPLFVLAACTLGPDYHPPRTAAPAAWSADKTGMLHTGDDATARLQRWWTLFGDAELDHLVDRAVAQNLDVKAASLRVSEARAALNYVRAGYFPSVTAAVGGSRQRLSTNDKFPPFGGVYNSFQAGFDTSWEIDVFGQTRREVEASKASVEQQEEQRHATLVTLLGDVGSDYAALRAAQDRLRIAQRNLAVAQQIVTLTQERNTQGLSSELDVAEAAAQLHTLESVVPDFQAEIAQREFAIAELLGEQPDALHDELSQDAGILLPPPQLPAAIPSAVIRNRPDIRAAERQLASATATIGVAMADYFPKFTINPSIDVNAGWLHRMLDIGALAWTIPANIQMPIFDSGKIAAEVSLARTYAAGELIAYQKAVLTAFREVESAIAACQAATIKDASLKAAVDANQAALDRATDLYRNGIGDFISVLDNERSLYAAEDSRAQSALTRAQQTIALYKALGSGWETLPEADAKNSPPSGQDSYKNPKTTLDRE